MPLVNIKEGLEINYKILNPKGKETITIIHGMFGNLSQFYLSIGPELAKTYKVLLYDLKSHGRSSRYAKGYDMETFVEELRLILNALHIEKSHLIGFSFGALMAIHAAVNYPNRIGKVIAMEVPPLPDAPVKGEGTYTWADFLGFAYSLPPDIIKNFFSSERRLKKTFAMYAYIFNETSFVKDTNARTPLSKKTLESLKNETLFLFGNTSVCLPELIRIQPWIQEHHIYIMEGTHGFFINRSYEVAQLLLQYLNGRVFKESNKKPIVLG